MGFESQSGDTGIRQSPGGFDFGVQGWVWGQPEPKNITFFLDNTAMVCDQYGRQIRRVMLNDGRDLKFADTPPDASREGDVTPRPQFATHKQTLDALKEEGHDWSTFQVEYTGLDGARRSRKGLTLDAAIQAQQKLESQGNKRIIVCRTIEWVGWPQLPYEELKQLPQLPPTPVEELRKILDPELRRAALRAKREADEVRVRAQSERDEEDAA